MKFLHISDLHLGRKFYGLTFLPQQEKMLTQIVQLVQEEHISGVLLAGDIYDKPIPPADAVTLFDAFLTELAQLQVQVFLISGNHDSPERLQFGSRLLEENRIHIVGVFRGELPCVTVSDACGPLHIYLMPFVKFHEAASFFKEQKPEDFSELLGQLIQQTPICPTERNLLLYHGFVTDATFAPECSDSEWQLGGMQNVDPAVFAPFDYVALGHIHKPQWVQKGKIRYSGSILKYSFSESRQKKSVTILEFGEKGKLQVTERELPVQTNLRTLRGPLEELLRCAEPSEDWIRVELTDEKVVPYAIERLRTVYPNVLEMVYLKQEERTPAVRTEAAAVPTKTLLELLETFYQDVCQYPIAEDPEAEALLKDICEEVGMNP